MEIFYIVPLFTICFMLEKIARILEILGSEKQEELKAYWMKVGAAAALATVEEEEKRDAQK